MISPDIKVALMFAGQGTINELGIWDKFMQSPKAQEIFRRTGEISGSRLSRLITEGPLEEIIETKNAQPAIIGLELAALSVTRELHPEIDNYVVAVAGHSAGENAALAAAGVISVDKAIELSMWRGHFMQEYGTRGKMAVIAADGKIVEELCKDTGAMAVNFNSPRQTVVSGLEAHVDTVMALARQAKISSKALPVPFAFHHLIGMLTAKEEYYAILKNTEFSDARVPVILNTTGQPETLAGKIKREVARQINSPVRWQDSMEAAITMGVNTFIEFGPQPVLTGLLRGINKEAKGIWVGDYDCAKNLSL